MKIEMFSGLEVLQFDHFWQISSIFKNMQTDFVLFIMMILIISVIIRKLKISFRCIQSLWWWLNNREVYRFDVYLTSYHDNIVNYVINENVLKFKIGPSSKVSWPQNAFFVLVNLKQYTLDLWKVFCDLRLETRNTAGGGITFPMPSKVPKTM